MVDKLWEKIIDPGSVFIIAEAGVNHNGDINLAKQLIDVAAEAGADSVKFQTFCAERLATPQAPKADYQVQTDPNSKSQLEMLQKLQLSKDDYCSLYEYCQDKGITFLSAPFDEESADFLEGLGLQVFKIPSGEITNIPLLIHIAKKKKPMIISTGMSTLSEVREAIRVVGDAGNNNIVILHCVSNYPAKPEDINLKAIQTMSESLAVSVGYSDHALGCDIALAAVVMGAVVVEKHFTLDRNLPGPDQRSSLKPAEFKSLVNRIHKLKLALGDGHKRPAFSEANVASVVRKSLVAGCDIKSGTMLSKGLIAIKRPGTGLAPSMISSLVGRKAKVDIPKDELLSLDMLI